MRFVFLFVSVLAVSACGASNEHRGTLSGSFLGGVIGSGFDDPNDPDAVSGSEAGAEIGGILGEIFDRHSEGRVEDRMLIAITRALNAGPGAVVPWEAPNYAAHGTVRVLRNVPARNGICREYAHRYVIGDHQYNYRDVACGRNGDWNI